MVAQMCARCTRIIETRAGKICDICRGSPLDDARLLTWYALGLTQEEVRMLCKVGVSFKNREVLRLTYSRRIMALLKERRGDDCMTEIRQLRRRGLKVQQIADRLGLSKGMVSGLIYRRGLEPVEGGGHAVS